MIRFVERKWIYFLISGLMIVPGVIFLLLYVTYRSFLEAARGGATPEERLSSMGQAYGELLANRDEILVQMQAHAAAGDPTLREPVRREFLQLREDVRRMSGASEEQVTDFLAMGMLLNVVAALELPDECVPMSGEAAA